METACVCTLQSSALRTSLTQLTTTMINFYPMQNFNVHSIITAGYNVAMFLFQTAAPIGTSSHLQMPAVFLVFLLG